HDVSLLPSIFLLQSIRVRTNESLLSRLTGDGDFGLLNFVFIQRINWSFSAQVVAFGGAEGRSEVFGSSQQCFLGLIGECLAASDLLVDLRGVLLQVLLHVHLEATDIFDGNDVEDAFLGQEDGNHLVFHWLRRRLRLLQQLNQTLAALKLCLGHWVQVRSEGSEALEVTVRSEVKTQVTCNLLHTLGLRSATNTRNRNTDVNCRTDALVEQVGLQEDLAVGNGNNVGWNERRNVIRLGFNNWQCGQGTSAQVVGQLCSMLQQTGVQVEDVTWVSFASRWTTQQQGNRTVSLSLLGQVIVDDQNVVALVHPVLTKGSAGEWSQPLKASGVRRRSS